MALTCGIKDLPLLYSSTKPFVTGTPPNLTGFVVDAYDLLIKICCNDASQINYTYISYPNMTDMMNSYRFGYSSAALAYPIFTTDLVLSVNSPQHYVKVLDLNAFVMVAQQPLNAQSGMGQAFLSAWPVILLIWGCTGFVAYIMWFLETFTAPDKTQMRRTFGLGILESYWNAFITASTIGYGDIVPQSWPGRVLCLLWITLASMLFSIMTGTFSSVFTTISANAVAFPGIAENLVAVLRDSIEARLVLQAGGTPVQYDDITDFVNSVLEGTTTLGLMNAYSYSNELSRYASSKAMLLGLREQVTNQFTAGVGFILGNTYSTHFPSNLFTCLQQETFINELVNNDGLAAIMSSLTKQEVESAAVSITSQLYVPSEMTASIVVAVSMVVLLVGTTLVFRFGVNRYIKKRRDESGDSTNQTSVTNRSVANTPDVALERDEECRTQ